MKDKQISSICIALIALLILPMVAAQEVETEVKNKINPDRPVLWGLDRAIEKITLLLTFSAEGKAERRLQDAAERLQEVEEMIEAKKLEYAERASEEFEKEMGKIDNEVEKKAELYRAEVLARIKLRIAQRLEKWNEVKEKVIEQMPNAEQRERFENITRRVTAVREKICEKIEARENAIKRLLD